MMIARQLMCLLTAFLWTTVGALPMQSLHAEGFRAQAQSMIAQSRIRGGLLLHLGCGDGRLTAELLCSDRYLVQAWDRDPNNVTMARAHIRTLGLCGAVSVEQIQNGRLPYTDNLANLIVVSDDCGISEAEMMRALAPGGVVIYVDGLRTITKPRPATIDDWTHYLYDATGNAVSHDQVVGPPQRLQWVVGPSYTRHHEHTTSITTIVSSAGRMFYIRDESPNVSIFMPPQWKLVARDAYNGILLWERPMGNWVPPLEGFRHNPPSAQRALVAVGDRVYVTLGFGKPIDVLDAATGETIRTLPGTDTTEEILVSDGQLFAVVGQDYQEADRGRGVSQDRELRRGIMVFDSQSGDLVWKQLNSDTSTLESLSLAVSGKDLFFLNDEAVVCLDADSGTLRWRTLRKPRTLTRKPVQPTVVAHEQVVLVADSTVRSVEHPNGELAALSADSGERLWSTSCGEGYVEPPDVFVADGLVWVGTDRRVGSKHSTREFSEGRDPLTGEVKRRLDTTRAFIDRPHHHRCYRNKATDRFLIVGRHGVEMIPLAGEEVRLHDWLRGACRYGVMPCNGLLYVPPHACSCHISQLLGHFRALSGAAAIRSADSETNEAPRLFYGPASEATEPLTSSSQRSLVNAWPTHRHDAARSGSTRAVVPASVQPDWTARLDGRPTAPTIADGQAFVAVPDRHVVHALDLNTGKQRWTFTAGARVDTPPTLCQGRVVFGSADGWVYCLRASDGEMVWKFRAAPTDRRIVAHGRVESAWPVHGSVLVRDGMVYAVAGRSSNLDGGMYVYQLDLETGQVMAHERLTASPDGIARRRQQGPNDLLSADKHSLSMQFQRWRLADLKPLGEKSPGPGESPRLICPTGFLDNSWFHRSHWTFGTSKVIGDPRTIGNRAPAGNMLVFNDTVLCGYGRKPGYFMWTTPVEFRLFAADRPIEMGPLDFKGKQPPHGYLRHPERQVKPRWEREIPLHVQAMTLAGRTLFVAGPPSVVKEGPPETFLDRSRLTDLQAQAALDAWDGRSGAKLWAVSSEDGTKLTELELKALPVWDGMAATEGTLLLACEDNSLICFRALD